MTGMVIPCHFSALFHSNSQRRAQQSRTADIKRLVSPAIVDRTHRAPSFGPRCHLMVSQGHQFLLSVLAEQQFCPETLLAVDVLKRGRSTRTKTSSSFAQRATHGNQHNQQTLVIKVRKRSHPNKINKKNRELRRSLASERAESLLQTCLCLHAGTTSQIISLKFDFFKTYY